MKASIIIPTHNRADQLFRTIKSLVVLDFDPDQYEIIIIDNGSKDNTKEIVNKYVEEYPKYLIRYFYDNIPGLLTGRHRGAKEAKGEILVFVDDDINADKGWLSAIVDTFKRNADVHLVGGKCLPKYETEPPAWLDYFWNFIPGGGKMLCSLSLCDFGEVEKEVDPTWVFGLNFSIRKTSLYELGGFNPDTVPIAYQTLQGDGETGLSLKTIKKGYKAIYQPKALVYHEVPSSRMTLEYFDKRYFFQGISNSYTNLRQSNEITSIITYPEIKRKIKNILRPIYQVIFPKPKVPIQTEANFEKEMLFSRFQTLKKAGYDFHQKMAIKNPEIMNWILKKNYFDYNLPKLTEK